MNIYNGKTEREKQIITILQSQQNLHPTILQKFREF